MISHSAIVLITVDYILVENIFNIYNWKKKGGGDERYTVLHRDQCVKKFISIFFPPGSIALPGFIKIVEAIFA